MAVVATRDMAPVIKIEAHRRNKNGIVLPLYAVCGGQATNGLCCAVVLCCLFKLCQKIEDDPLTRSNSLFIIFSYRLSTISSLDITTVSSVCLV
jgi:hypothetical protein